ncbi:restriction endonuclease [Myxococcus qinghaiensis]|uniref:restriction endonuclease n=1 Tax=Myxococcus qinghaiensis TaxID=2906758 RepID=UPI0038992ECE
MKPGIRPGQLPPFHTIDEYAFQDLCRDLFDAEEGIAACDVYGTRGQGQQGIDLIARRASRDGIEVGQCKCYAQFQPADIRKASEDFLLHKSTGNHKT